MTDETVNNKSMLDQLFSEIEQDRDRLKLQAHLFKADATDEWDKIEKKWHQLKGNTQHVGQEAKEVSKDLLAATQLLGEEIKTGYKRIFKSL
jgi:hypothetical protein